MTLFKDLMKWNRLQSVQMNKILADADNAMIGVIKELKHCNQSNTVIDLFKAVNLLCKPKYERYTEKKNRLDKHLMLHIEEASETATVSNITNSLSKQQNSFHKDKGLTARNVPPKRMFSQDLVLGGFHPSLFQPRLFLQLKITTSLNGWAPTMTSTVNTVLGTMMEDTNNHSDDDNESIC